MSTRVEGADQLRAVGKALRGAGDQGKALRKDLLREIREVTKGPAGDELKAAATRRLPSRGGLAAYTAKNLKVTSRTKLSGNEVGVTVVATVKGMDLPKLEAGKLRHPVYGRAPWVNQSIPAGIFGDAVQELAGDVGKAILRAVEDTARKIERS